MLFLLVTGTFCIVAPTWILGAIGLGHWEDDRALQGITRAVGAIVVALALWFVPHWQRG